MLIRVPESWPQPLVAVLAMVVLAVVDLASAVAAKEAVARRSLPIAALGLALYAVLFWVYSSSLRYADLAPVTLGWVVVLQIGVLLLDRFRYGAQLTRGQWVAVGVLLAAQAYLLLGAGTGRPAEPGARRAAGRPQLSGHLPDPGDLPVPLALLGLPGPAFDGVPLPGAGSHDLDAAGAAQPVAGRYSSAALR